MQSALDTEISGDLREIITAYATSETIKIIDKLQERAKERNPSLLKYEFLFKKPEREDPIAEMQKELDLLYGLKSGHFAEPNTPEDNEKEELEGLTRLMHVTTTLSTTASCAITASVEKLVCEARQLYAFANQLFLEERKLYPQIAGEILNEANRSAIPYREILANQKVLDEITRRVFPKRKKYETLIRSRQKFRRKVVNFFRKSIELTIITEPSQERKKTLEEKLSKLPTDQEVEQIQELTLECLNQELNRIYGK